MTANVQFGTAGVPVVLLPLTAVTKKDDKNLVWVVEGADNKVSPRPVQIGKFSEDGVTILEGLKPGERVVAVGVHKLQPGQVVRPLEQSPAAKAGRP
jgi:multidrug efflux system membrane fusion protein